MRLIGVLLPYIVSAIACWNAHIAGIGYTRPTAEGHHNRWAIVRSCVSIVLAAAAVYWAQKEPR
jgi:hypothetical protein